MITSNKKNYLIAILWLICGFLSRFSSSYLFSFVTSNLMEPTSKYLRSIFHLNFSRGLVGNILFHVTDLIIVFSVSFLLARLTEKRKLWLIAFIIGVIGLPLYGTIRYEIAFENYYGSSPESTTLLIQLVIEKVVADLIITPLVALLGVSLGHQYRMKKTTG